MSYARWVGVIMQIISVLTSMFAVTAGALYINDYANVNDNIQKITLGILIILGSLMIMMTEIYIFRFFRNFCFILKFWGKAFVYIIFGFLLFSTKGLGLACGIVFWIVSFAFLVLTILIEVPPPLLQGGISGDKPDFQIDANEIFP